MRAKDAAAAVERWNVALPVGSEVEITKDDGSVLSTKTTSQAWLLGDHTPVVMLEGVSGGYLLERVKPKGAPKIGRLAMRQEGELWVAYYADPDTMDGAQYLGSIRMVFVESQDRKSEFLGLMRECMGDIIEEKLGQRPIWPDGLKPAPVHERGLQVSSPYLK